MRSGNVTIAGNVLAEMKYIWQINSLKSDTKIPESDLIPIVYILDVFVE